MSNFNFNIKKSTYDSCLKNAKQALSANDLDTGLAYIDKAITVGRELALNAIVPEIKAIYQSEQGKLREIRNTIVNGNNPFLVQRRASTNSNQAPSSNASASNQGGSSNATSNTKDTKVESHYFNSESPKVRLCDIAGLENVKEQIRLNVIAPLNNPEIYFKYSDSVGCQILMYGPPGCGKSFIAEAIAGELKCPYAIINTFDILDKYVGEAPKKIKEIFDEANKYESSLLFFDELDSLFASRESDDSAHTKDVLTAFLTCLSGFHTDKDNKSIRVVIGATNRPWVIDSALLRGKRFDTQLYVGLPDYEAREFLIKKEFKHREGLLDNTDIDIPTLVDMLDGYSGADIGAILNKIKLKALKRALDNKANGIDREEPVTLRDTKEVMGEYRNSITEESLAMFEAFRNGAI